MPTRWPDLERLIDILEEIETGGIREQDRDLAVGDGGAALGRLQIHRIAVDDVNRILRRALYRYEDRTDRSKARDLCGIYLRHWGGKLPLSVRRDEPEMVKALARIWNGGPTGWLKPATIPYGRKALKKWA
jgi:hypothetical protein